MSLARIRALRRVDRGTRPARGALRVVEQQFAVLHHHDEVHLEAARGTWAVPPAAVTSAVILTSKYCWQRHQIPPDPVLYPLSILMSSAARVASLGVMGQSGIAQGLRALLLGAVGQNCWARATICADDTGSGVGVVTGVGVGVGVG